MNNFVLKGLICFTKNPQEFNIYENYYLVCLDGMVKGIYETLPDEFKNLKLYDYTNKLIFPGMIDLHVHAPQYPFRGMSMDLELMDWLNNYTFPEEEKYAYLDYANKAYNMFVDDLKHSATSRASVFATRHRDATTLLMGLLEKSGLITFVGKVNMDREATDNLVEESPETSAFDTIGWVNDTINSFKNTKPILTPRFIPSCTDELMEELRQIQMLFGLPVQSHLSESLDEIEFVKTLRPFNKFYGEAYHEYGLFGKNEEDNKQVKTIMAHCVWSTEEEINLMKNNGVYIAHCPTSNTNLSSGIAPIRKYLDLKMNIGLGTDIAAGHSLSMFNAIKDAIQVSKLYFRLVNKESAPLRLNEAFYLATKGGGSFFGKVGSFEEDFEFDAIILDDSIFNSPRDLTTLERIERAIYLSLDEKGLVSKFVKGNKIL